MHIIALNIIPRIHVDDGLEADEDYISFSLLIMTRAVWTLQSQP